MLHTVSTQTIHESHLQSCLNCIQPEDEIVLLGDASYALLQNNLGISQLLMHQVYVLDTDIQARGVDNKLPETIRCISYSDFVDLTEKHEVIQAWP